MTSENTSVAISFRASAALHSNLLMAAEDEGVTVSTLCRRLLEKAIKQYAHGAQGGVSGRIANIRSRARRRLSGRW